MSQQRQFSFLVVCFLAFYGEIFGQKNTLNVADFAGFISVREKPVAFPSKFKSSYILLPSCAVQAQNHYQLLHLPGSGYYVSTLEFICKKELQLDRYTPVRFRFRLGSPDYVNWLEQKPNAKRY